MSKRLDIWGVLTFLAFVVGISFALCLLIYYQHITYHGSKCAALQEPGDE